MRKGLGLTTFASASVNNNTLGGVEFEVTFIYIV
jgi:hypothetical protein